jgi:hypothetical protein
MTRKSLSQIAAYLVAAIRPGCATAERRNGVRTTTLTPAEVEKTRRLLRLRRDALDALCRGQKNRLRAAVLDIAALTGETPDDVHDSLCRMQEWRSGRRT